MSTHALEKVQVYLILGAHVLRGSAHALEY